MDVCVFGLGWKGAYGVGVGCEGEEPVYWDAVEGVIWRHIDRIGGTADGGV
jgi:hypothetical protein